MNITHLDRRELLKTSAFAAVASLLTRPFQAMANQVATAGDASSLEPIGVQAPFGMLTVGGNEIAFTRHGKGQPILCLHAVGHGARDFEPLTQHLSEQFEIIAIDFPGHGRSPRGKTPISSVAFGELVVAVINTLGLERPVLLGNSVGGGAAIVAAANLQESIAGLVLCDSAGLIPPSPFAAQAMQQIIGMFQLGVANNPQFQQVFTHYYTNVVLPAAPAKPQRERIIAAGYSLAPLLLEAWQGFLEPASYLGNLIEKVNIPVWLAWAKNDQLVAWDFCKATAEKFPQYSFDFFEGGHSPFLEDPDAFAVKLASFVQSLG